MFPLHDTQEARKLPVATYLLIAVNVAVFFLELTNPNPEGFISKYALIPAKIDFGDYSTFTPFITSQFLHAGFLHILSNMWFLKIFGDNVEEKFGSIPFVLIYLFAGVIGGFMQYLFAPGSSIPMLGASGAVAGVLGSYLVFFPNHRIESLVFFGLFITTVRIPAYLMLIYWFLIQLFSGVGSIAVAQTGGVAFWAHVGGFASGWLISKLMDSGEDYLEEGEVLN